MSKDLNFLYGIYITHRGMFNNADIPENSIKAFKLSLENNHPIELDVQLSKDGKIVVYHDKNLKRLTNVNSKLSDLDYDNISNLSLLKTEEKIPLLEEILKLINGKVFILIELKKYENGYELEKRLSKMLDNYNGKFAIQSFDPTTIIWFKNNRPNFIRGQLSYDYSRNNKLPNFQKIALKNLYYNFFGKPDFVSYALRSMPNKYVENYRKNNPVLIWTINDKHDMKIARQYGDGFIVNNIEKSTI
ncbi:MAG: glycerophosphodiester phosphodiesterase family protein [Bacilli bacterium]